MGILVSIPFRLLFSNLLEILVVLAIIARCASDLVAGTRARNGSDPQSRISRRFRTTIRPCASRRGSQCATAAFARNFCGVRWKAARNCRSNALSDMFDMDASCRLVISSWKWARMWASAGPKPGADASRLLAGPAARVIPAMPMIAPFASTTGILSVMLQIVGAARLT